MTDLNHINYLDPFAWCTQTKSLEGKYDLAQFEQLTIATHRTQEGIVNYHLDFYRDERGRALIKGHLNAFLTLICERCLENFSYEVNNKFLVAPLTTEKALKDLPNSIEPLIIFDKPLLLAPFIEEELLLNLPVIARHLPETCKKQFKDYTVSPPGEECLETKAHPFAALQHLKKND